jgi:hypothetical protein
MDAVELPARRGDRIILSLVMHARREEARCTRPKRGFRWRVWTREGHQAGVIIGPLDRSDTTG